MALSESEVQSMLLQAQEQSGGGNTPPATITAEVVTTKKEGEIIEPVVAEYKTPEQLREEATALALEAERVQEITILEAKLLEDASLTPEERADIEVQLKVLNPKEEEEEGTKQETQDELIARLQKEVEELKSPKVDTNPLAVIEAKVTEAGIDLNKLHEEYYINGEVSKEQLESLNKAGFDKNAIEAYIETKKAKGEAEANQLMTSTTGSVENYTTMTKWMQDNLTDSEINEYDAGVVTPHAKIYIENMYSKYTKANTQPTLIRGDGGYNANSIAQNAGFRSINEQNMAMADSRYGNDTKYTTMVRNKVAKSTY